jgi:NAD(P)-dependent dehydrogenase (short-subunit alcohol dehydrogenase family)
MKVALITGASSGIGKEIALRLLADGYYVAVTGRNMKKLEEAYSSIDAGTTLLIEADATHPESYTKCVEHTIKSFGRLDVLVNNVGGGTFGQTLQATTLADWNASFSLNTTSVFFTTQASLPYLIESKGVVINFSSVLASRPVTGLGPYSASKAAVEMLTKSLALELAPKGIRVLCISPATIQTGFHTAAGMTQEVANAYYTASSGTHPIGRIGQTQDISELVAFLADNSKAGFMTGSVIHVDGGRLLTSSAPALTKST